MKMKSIVILVALLMSVAAAGCGQKEVHIIGGIVDWTGEVVTE